MEKNTKIIIAVLALVLVFAVVVLSAKSDLFQGRMFLSRKCAIVAYDCSKLYAYKNSIVSVVASPVTSVLASSLTSGGGTSQVASVVTSSVASAVTVKEKDTKDVDKSKLVGLTGEILRSVAQREYRNNPSRFTLSSAEKTRILDLYRQKNPSKIR